MIAGCEAGYTLKFYRKHLLYLLENQIIFISFLSAKRGERKTSRSMIDLFSLLSCGYSINKRH